MQTIFNIANSLIEATRLPFFFLRLLLLLLTIGHLNERGNIAAKVAPFKSSRPNLNDTANALNGMIARPDKTMASGARTEIIDSGNDKCSQVQGSRGFCLGPITP